MYFPRNLHSHSRDSSSLDIKSTVYKISRERKKVDLSGDNNRRKEKEEERSLLGKKGGAKLSRHGSASNRLLLISRDKTKGGNGC